MSKMLFVLTVFVMAYAACQKTSSEDVLVSLAEILPSESADLQSSQDNHIHYIARFSDLDEAREHEQEVRRHGGEARAIGSSQEWVRASLPASQSAKIKLPKTTAVANDAKVTIIPRSRAEISAEARKLADEVMTAKSVIKVDQFRQEYPKANGEGVVVAVFDTGIDFGLEGVSDGQGEDRKLIGFYDHTNFARIKLTEEKSLTDQDVVLSDSQSQKVTFDLKSLELKSDLNVQKLLFKGVLSEEELARDYLASSVDLNDNRRDLDHFNYVVGINAAGEKAVWIDANGNGVIDGAEHEELTDFNTTGKFIHLRRVPFPSGAKPLAVTFHGDDEIQFHTVGNGHGTSCAIVIGGDGYANGFLEGMAPKTKFLSYMLDVTGQDIYTISQFMEMFLHALDQGADVISISWGMTVADIKSARALSEFLDYEIAGKGVVIAIANGNEGPAYSSGYSTDYLPHHGFAVGAMISTDQAANVYGWNGDNENSVIWYSSYGPTRGGRMVPDLISPLMTMVRGERVTKGEIFRGFGGTSSATPALAGGIASLISQLKIDDVKVEPRLLKMAAMDVAERIPHVDLLRQGAGVLNIKDTYERYLELYQEWYAASQDSSRRTSFAYDIKVRTKSGHSGVESEGIVLDGFQESQVVHLSISASSLRLIDDLHFAEPLVVTHHSDFLRTQDSVLMQSSGARFSVQLLSDKLHLPGTYTDVIELRRPQDGLILARVPVVVRIPNVVRNQYQIDSINQMIGMNDLWRSNVVLTEAMSLTFDGVAMDRQDGFGTFLGIYVQNIRGQILYSERIPLQRSLTKLSFSTDLLPKDHYEIIMYRGGDRPAVVTPIQVSGAWQRKSISAVATEIEGHSVRVLVKSALPSLDLDYAILTIDRSIHEVALELKKDLPRPGYYGEIAFDAWGKMGVRLKQSAIDRHLEDFLHVSLAMINLESNNVLSRGWINMTPESAPFQMVDLYGNAEKIGVLAYPNIVSWDRIETKTLHLQLAAKLEKKIISEKQNALHIFEKSEHAALEFKMPEDLEIPVKGSGYIEFFGTKNQLSFTVPVEW